VRDHSEFTYTRQPFVHSYTLLEIKSKADGKIHPPPQFAAHWTIFIHSNVIINWILSYENEITQENRVTYNASYKHPIKMFSPFEIALAIITHWRDLIHVHVLHEIEGWLPNYLLLRNSQEEFLKLLLSLFGGSELTLCTFDHDATNTYTSDGGFPNQMIQDRTILGIFILGGIQSFTKSPIILPSFVCCLSGLFSLGVCAAIHFFGITGSKLCAYASHISQKGLLHPNKSRGNSSWCYYRPCAAKNPLL
jgi:hypothetical protein